MDRPAVRFSQVINAGPEELAADIIVIPYSLPGLIAVSVFTAQERQGGKTAVILFLQKPFIVVAPPNQRVQIMQPGGKPPRGARGAGRGGEALLLGGPGGGGVRRGAGGAPGAGQIPPVPGPGQAAGAFERGGYL